MPQKCMECFGLLFDHLAWIEHQFLSDIWDSRKAGSLWEMMRGMGGVRKSIHQSWLAKGLGLLCWGFKGVQEEIPSEEASTLQIGLVAFPPGQCTSHNSILVTDYLTKMILKIVLTLPIVQTKLPVTFGYSLSSEAFVMRQLRRWKRLWWRSLTRSHKRTSMGRCRSCWNGTTSALQLEEFTSCLCKRCLFIVFRLFYVTYVCLSIFAISKVEISEKLRLLIEKCNVIREKMVRGSMCFPCVTHFRKLSNQDDDSGLTWKIFLSGLFYFYSLS